jgi:hypothetical protein
MPKNRKLEPLIRFDRIGLWKKTNKLKRKTGMSSEPLFVSVVFSILSACIASPAFAQQDNGQQHGHRSARGASPLAPAAEVPPLRILMPREGEIVGTQLAVVFQTPADLNKFTADAAKVGVHLHIEADGMMAMPLRRQLIGLGKDRYVFLFDLPAKPGPDTLRIYWADEQHDEMKNTIRQVSVIVAPEAPH